MPTRLDLPPPPVVSDPAGGGGSDWVPLITADDDIDAHLLQGRLNHAGIEVRAVKDRKGPSWMHGGSNPWAPVGIWVRRHQLEESRLLLAELSFSGPAAQREDTGASRRRSWVLWWTAAIALGVLFTGIGLARSADYLDRCGLSPSCAQPSMVRP
ncbi:MAG TPA: DUF2007 domain-containing protein [Actinomycetota bacterium]|nr:DUF2007 domain-containing protein [Actinomycetota bacterium]